MQPFGLVDRFDFTSKAVWKHPRVATPPAPATHGPNVAAQEVGRLPQTTVGIPGGGPFIRYSQTGQQPGYVASGQAFGAPITLPVPAVSGFLKSFLIKVVASGGTGAAVPVAAADAPWSAIQSLSLRDASGQPVFQSIDGFGLFLINLYSGQCGQGGQQDPRNLPSFSAIVTTSGANAGGFTFKLWVPLQLNSSGYCALPADNSAETMKLSINLAAASAVYSTPPTTPPTLTLTVEEPYQATPNNMPHLAPYDVGASSQWSVSTSGQNPPNGAAARVLDAGVGQFIHTKIYVLRDSTNARIDSFPASDLTLWVDNFPYLIELSDDRFDKMFKAFNVTRPTGVLVHTWRDSVQTQVSDADDGENYLVTTGATKLEIGGTWGTISNQPAQVSSYTGMVFPGPSGFPYHSQGH